MLVAAAAVLVYLALAAGPEPRADAARNEAPPAFPEADAPAPALAEPEPEPPVVVAEAPLAREVAAAEVDTEHRIEGTVVDDLEQPVQRFRVTARFRPAEGEREWQERDLGEFGAGRFVLTDLEDGTWKLRATAAGHSPSRSELVRIPHRKGHKGPIALALERRAVVAGRVLDPFGVGVAGAEVVERRHGGAGSLRTDEAGAFELEVDPGAFELVAKGAVLAPSEPVTGAVEVGQRLEGVMLVLRQGGRLTGEVLDEAGGARAGWWVQVTTTDWRLSGPRVQADQAGRFVVEHLSPGTYMVNAVEGEDERPGTTPLRTVVTIEAEETVHVVLGGVDEDAIRIRGVVTLQGEPVAETMVWSLNEGSESYASGQVQHTDAEGRFEMTLPEPGPAMLLTQVPLDGGSSKGTLTYHFDFGPEREHEVELRVPLGRIAGSVLGPDGRPTERRKVVQLQPESEDPITTQFKSRTTRTDDQGRFAFEYLEAGSYRVSMMTVVGPDSTSADIRLGPDGARDDVLLRATETGSVEVAVVDGAGDPVRGAAVYAHDVNGAAHGVPNSSTSEAGTLKFRNLAPGRYRFFARKEGLASTPGEVVVVRADETAETSLQLVPAALMRVVVEDEGGHELRAHLRVLDETGRDFATLVDSIDFKRYVTEGYSSTTRRVGPLVPGTYRILARLDDGQSMEHEVTLAPGAEELVRIRPEE